jgi:branched-chain amino acid transport system permease protein
LRGIFFAIATLALAVVLQTLITNWDFVGGSAGVYAIRPKHIPVFGSYIEYMVFLMLLVAAGVVAVSRAIERSSYGLGFTAIRDDEVAAEATGVPTLRLKLIATTLSAAFMARRSLNMSRSSNRRRPLTCLMQSTRSRCR